MADDRIDRVDDGVQHGIDDNPNDDAAKGAALGGLGGAAVGAAAGSMAGIGGAVIGAVIGGVAGAAASGAAVAAVDGMDNDDTVTGMGDGVTADDTFDDDYTAQDTGAARDTFANTIPVTPAAPGTGYAAGMGGLSPTTTGRVTDDARPVGQYDTATNADTGTRYETDPTLNAQNSLPGNRIPGVQTGGRDVDGTPDTRGISEKVSDAVTGDHIDDKTGKPV